MEIHVDHQKASEDTGVERGDGAEGVANVTHGNRVKRPCTATSPQTNAQVLALATGR